MLVLSRKRDESIMINDNIEVTIVDIRGDKVRLGITAPTEIPVHRREIYDAIQREKKEKKETPVYNIAEEDADGNFGIWCGPNPSLKQMLETDGRSGCSVIIEVPPFENSKVIYRWNMSQSDWQKGEEDV